MHLSLSTRPEDSLIIHEVKSLGFLFQFIRFFFFLLCLVSQSSPVPVLAFGTHHLFSSLPMGATSYREYVLIMLVIRTADITTLYVNFHISAWIRNEFQEMHPQSVGMVSGSMFVQSRDVWLILWEAILNLKRSMERSQSQVTMAWTGSLMGWARWVRCLYYPYLFTWRC